MKTSRTLVKFALMAAAAVATPAAAMDGSGTLATFGFAVSQADAHPTVAKVALQDDGRLVIEKSIRDAANQSDESLVRVISTTAQLSAPTMELLKDKIVMLSAAEINTSVSQFVCMMMPPFGSDQRILQVRRDFDWQTQSFKGALQVVDNNAGCWAVTHIAPKQDYANIAAKELESELEVLSIEAISGDLQ
jgi:hypothetical protein